MQSFIFNSYSSGFSFDTLLPIFIALMLIVIILKGYAMWCSARGNQKWWFIALLVINTMGILEIVYLLFFRPEPLINTIKDRLKKNSSDNSEKTK